MLPTNVNDIIDTDFDLVNPPHHNLWRPAETCGDLQNLIG